MDTRIQTSARRLRLGAIVAMAMFGGIYLIGRLGISVAGTHVEYRAHDLQGAAPAVAADLTVALLLVALIRLMQMLTLIGRGEMFTAAVVSRFRGFAFWLLMMALCSFLGPMVAQVLTHGPGRHRLVIALELNDVLMVGITLLLFILARMLERARALDEEMREIV